MCDILIVPICRERLDFRGGMSGALKLGFFIIISAKENLPKEDVLAFYRDKDKIEKIFDSSKNELNTNRLHSYSKTTTEGRLFVKFIATILYQQRTKVMKDNDMFKNYSVTELLKELSKMKMISLPEVGNFTTECSKKQREIWENLRSTSKHSDKKKFNLGFNCCSRYFLVLSSFTAAKVRRHF